MLLKKNFYLNLSIVYPRGQNKGGIPKENSDYRQRLNEILKQTENLSSLDSLTLGSNKSCDNYSFLTNSTTVQNLSSTTLDNSTSASESTGSIHNKILDKSLTDTVTHDQTDQSSNSPISSHDSSDCITESETHSEHVYDNQLNAKMPTDLSLMQTNTSPPLNFQLEIDDFVKQKIDEKLKECETGDSDSDSEVQVYTPKGVDLPSAQRLAKRLYYLDGFRSSDVVRHLSKNLITIPGVFGVRGALVRGFSPCKQNQEKRRANEEKNQ
ncbi:arf6 guanine nucleotide exchange factor [Brachionus plicatilis]|uniref:Arf6 guanine nucleotide exchange factor n=1 Tax=Brachionus plicatilis TaxID=10195 RepID=A0A3M7P2U6_BRAPC|nr:arf6 guanine nucleotide exchange factor [Brachionus plicatilis]